MKFSLYMHLHRSLVAWLIPLKSLHLIAWSPSHVCRPLQSEDFFSLVKFYEGKALKLLVYSTETDCCREVVVTPNGAWGGEGRYAPTLVASAGGQYRRMQLPREKAVTRSLSPV